MNLREILILYRILSKYLPEVAEDGEIDVLEYSNTVVNNIILGNNPDAYVQALLMMAKITLPDLVKLDAYARLLLFIDCVYANRLWLLKDYLRKIGYGDSSGQ